MSAVGGISLADRDRANTAGAYVVNNPPILTQAQLYNDFIFGNNNSTLGAGVNILIEHLVPNTAYGVTLWSFDPQSTTTPRVSDWTEIASGTPVPIATGYTFNGSVLPVTDYEYTLGGLLTSSPAGQLQIQGVKSGGDITVFLNALRIEATPTPTSRIMGASVVNGNLQLAGGRPISRPANQLRAEQRLGWWNLGPGGRRQHPFHQRHGLIHRIPHQPDTIVLPRRKPYDTLSKQCAITQESKGPEARLWLAAEYPSGAPSR